MEEDVLGTMRAVHPTTYVECSRCGKMVRQLDAHIVVGTALADQSEYAQLCPDCYAAVVAGEQDLTDEM
jgi:endogenous inhibitor of DNA gyrase (YacG/DUF329 family)